MGRKFVEPKIAHLGTQQNIVVAIAAALKCCSSAVASAEGLEGVALTVTPTVTPTATATVIPTSTPVCPPE